MIVFPDTVEWLVGYLSAALPGHGYRSKVSQFYDGSVGVWLQRDGGPQLDQLREQPRIRVNVFRDDVSEIIDFAHMVSALIVACPTGEPVLSARQVSGPSLVVPSVKPQALMSFELTVRGRQLTPA